MCSCSLYFAVPRWGHDLGICRTKLEDEESLSRAMLEIKYFVETIPRHKNHVCNLRLRVVFVLVVPPSFAGLCAILRGIASGAQVGSHVSSNICQHNVNCKVAIAMPMSISVAGPRSYSLSRWPVPMYTATAPHGLEVTNYSYELFL